MPDLTRSRGVPLEEKGSVLSPMEGKQRGHWLDRPGDSWTMRGERIDESYPTVQLGRGALCPCSGPDSPHTFAVGHMEKLSRPCAAQRGQMSVCVCLEPTLVLPTYSEWHLHHMGFPSGR